MPSILTLETASQNFIILFIAIVHQFNGNQIRDSLLDGLEKPSSASTGSEMSKSDSYQDFREGTCIYASIQICIIYDTANTYYITSSCLLFRPRLSKDREDKID